MARQKFPRRKVVKSFQESVSDNWFCCTLSCGHTVSANGRRDKRDRHGFYGMPQAPKSCECRKCGQEKTP